MICIPYKKSLKEYSRQLRLNSTKSEILLWEPLKSGGMDYTFNRQKPLNNYIVDFYCRDLNLVIEIDGKYHNEPEQIVKDEERQKLLTEMNINFLRFTEMEVRKNIERTLEAIKKYIADYKSGLYPKNNRGVEPILTKRYRKIGRI